MTVTAMAIGVLQNETPCAAVARRFGRGAALVVGISMLVAITMFQASNNNALLMAAEGFLGSTSPAEVKNGPAEVNTGSVESSAENKILNETLPWGRAAIPLAFNLVIIGLLWASRRELYRRIETAMAVLVGLMVLAFATNLWFANPSWSGIVAGLIPSWPNGGSSNLDEAAGSTTAAVSWMTTGAMVATTFSVAAAFYQSYQVREKGWGENDLRLGMVDSLIGICSLGAITMMILVTAAAALHQVVSPSSLVDAAAVAIALEPMFGPAARYVFAMGVLAGAVSSFVVNALIGAVVFCDSLGKSTKLSEPPVRVTTIFVLLLGWIVASIGIFTKIPLAEFIVVAQALTVIAFPILAATLIWQVSSVKARLPVWVMPLNYIGFIITLLLSARTIIRLTTG